MNPAACKETKSCNQPCAFMPVTPTKCLPSENPTGRGRGCHRAFLPSLPFRRRHCPWTARRQFDNCYPPFVHGEGHKKRQRRTDGRTADGGREGWTWDILNEPLTVATTRGHDSTTRPANWSQLGTNMWILLRRRRRPL